MGLCDISAHFGKWLSLLFRLRSHFGGMRIENRRLDELRNQSTHTEHWRWSDRWKVARVCRYYAANWLWLHGTINHWRQERGSWQFLIRHRRSVRCCVGFRAQGNIDNKLHQIASSHLRSMEGKNSPSLFITTKRAPTSFARSLLHPAVIKRNSKLKNRD